MRYASIAALTNQSIATSAASTNIPASYVAMASMQVAVTGGTSPTGTIVLQGSNDNTNPTNWVTVPNSSLTISADGVQSTGPLTCVYNYLRANYTATSGTGTLNVQVQVQGWTR